MLTASYILSFIATVLGLIEPFGKNMKIILVFTFVGNLLVGMSYLMVGEMSGATICFIACAQVFINFLFNLKNKKISIWLISIYLIVFVSVNLLTFANWYDIFALIAAVIFVISVAQSSAKYYRVLYFSNSTVWIFYDFLSASYGNLFTHIVLFVSTLISIIIRDKKKRLKTQKKVHLFEKHKKTF